MTKSKRIQWLDFGKGITIFSVLLAHSMQYANINNKLLVSFKDILFIFIMPCFFAISGYLYKRTDTGHKYLVLIYKKVTSFVIPYLVFSILFLWLSYYLNGWKTILEYSNLFNLVIHPYGYVWFLFALFFIFLIVGFLDLCHLNLVYQGIIYLLLCGFQSIKPVSILVPNGNMTFFGGIGGYVIFFFLGELLHIYNNVFRYQIFKSKKFLLSSSVLWLISILLYIKLNGIAYNTLSVDVVTDTNLLPKLISVLVFFSLFINFRHNKIFSYFNKYGKQTLIIYLVHFLVLTYVADKWLIRINWAFPGAGIIKILILAVIGWVASVLMCWLSNRSRVVNFVFYPRKCVDKWVLDTNYGNQFFVNYIGPDIKVGLIYIVFKYFHDIIYSLLKRFKKYKLNQNNTESVDERYNLNVNDYLLLDRYKYYTHYYFIKIIKGIILCILFVESFTRIIPYFILKIYDEYYLSSKYTFSDWSSYSSSVIEIIIAIFGFIFSIYEFRNRNRDPYLSSKLNDLQYFIDKGSNVRDNIISYLNSNHKITNKDYKEWKNNCENSSKKYFHKLLLFQSSFAKLDRIVHIKDPVGLSKLSRDLNFYSNSSFSCYNLINRFFNKQDYDITNNDPEYFIRIYKKFFYNNFSKLLKEFNKCQDFIRNEKDLKRK